MVADVYPCSRGACSFGRLIRAPSGGVSLSRWGLLLRLVQIRTGGRSVPGWIPAVQGAPRELHRHGVFQGWIPARAGCAHPVGIYTNLAGVSLLAQAVPTQ